MFGVDRLIFVAMAREKPGGGISPPLPPAEIGLTLARPTHLFQQLQLWKALDFGGKFLL